MHVTADAPGLEEDLLAALLILRLRHVYEHVHLAHPPRPGGQRGLPELLDRELDILRPQLVFVPRLPLLLHLIISKIIIMN